MLRVNYLLRQIPQREVRGKDKVFLAYVFSELCQGSWRISKFNSYYFSLLGNLRIKEDVFTKGCLFLGWEEGGGGVRGNKALLLKEL